MNRVMILVILVAAALQRSNASAMASSDKPMPFKLVTFNIDTNLMRLEDGFARKSHANFRVSARMPHILNALRRTNADVIHIQEGRRCDNSVGELVDSVSPLVSGLELLGYTCVTEKYNPSEKAFTFVTAFRSNRFDLQSKRMYYLTETPGETQTPRQMAEYDTITKEMDGEVVRQIKGKWRELNGFEEFEKSALIVELSDKLANNRVLTSVNVHLGIGDRHRMYASEKLNQLFESLDVDASVVLAGDFNSFPDWKGPEQLAMLNAPDLARHVKVLDETSGQYVYVARNATFVSFPYDWGPYEKEQEVRDRMDEIRKLNPDQDAQAIRQLVKQNVEYCIARGGEEAGKEGSAQGSALPLFPLGGHLDHILFKNLKPANDFALMEPAWISGDETGHSMAPLDLASEMMKRLDEEVPTPMLASDHQPLSALFEYQH